MVQFIQSLKVKEVVRSNIVKKLTLRGKIKIMKKLIFPLLSLMFIASCQKSDCKDAVKATFVDKTGLDGCGMVIQLTDDSYLEATNIDELTINPEDGMKIWVSYKEVTEESSICMIGDIVEVECVEKR